MVLTNKDIKDFQGLYKKHFDIELDNETARFELTLLVRQMEIVYQPITVSQFDRYLAKYVNEDKNYGKHDNS